MCNHPELFERRDAKSPIDLQRCFYMIPRLVYDYDIQSTMFLVMQKLFVLATPEYVARSSRDFRESIFGFCHPLNLSHQDIYKIFAGNLVHRYVM